MKRSNHFSIHFSSFTQSQKNKDHTFSITKVLDKCDARALVSSCFIEHLHWIESMFVTFQHYKQCKRILTFQCWDQNMWFKNVLVKPTDNVKDIKQYLIEQFDKLNNPIKAFTNDNIFVLKKRFSPYSFIERIVKVNSWSKGWTHVVI